MRKPKTAAIMAGLVVAAVSVLGLAAPAWAVPPPPLGSSYVLDQADVLTNAQEAEVQSRLLRLSEQTGLDLWVVFVDDFTEPTSAADWANETANRNSLGPHQYLLAVSVDGRAYYLSGDVDDGTLTADQLAAIEQERVQPALSAGDWAGAADAAATGITAAAQGTKPPPPTPAGGGPDIALIALVVFLVLALSSGDGRDGLALALYIVIAATDYLDGITARITGQYSRLGALLDPLVDRLLVISAVVVTYRFDLLPRWALIVLAVREALMLVLTRIGMKRDMDLKVNMVGR